MRSIIKKEVLQSNLIAILDDRGNAFTYKKLANEARELSQFIVSRSVIFLLCDHQTETLKFLYKVFYLKSIPMLLSADMDSTLIENLIKIYQPQYIYCKKTSQFAKKYLYNIEFDTHVLLKTGYIEYPVHPDLALLLSTSGTTGSAKLVRLSYNNLYDNISNACQKLVIQKGQKGISPLPINHIYGLDFCLWHWHCGATLLVTEESVISKKFLEFYKKEEANNFAGTPYIYKILKRIQFWDSEKVGYLHVAMSAGEQMPKEEQKNLVFTLGDKFWISYGQTECAYMISAMNFDRNNIKLGSVGKALDNVKIEINSNEELLVKSKSVCMGYANTIEELANGDINQGIIYTGDKAWIDEDGCIYLKGRLTRYIKILGKRVNLDDIEEYLRNKFPSREFACIGSDNFIVVFFTGLEENLDKEVSVILDRYMRIPQKFIFCMSLKELPRSNTGKILYTKLEELRIGKTGIGNM